MSDLQSKTFQPMSRFAEMMRTPAGHFNLYFYAAVLHVIEQVSIALGSCEAAFEQFPFLVGYNNELAEHGLAGMSSGAAALWWAEALRVCEETSSCHLPLRALSEAAALDHPTLTTLLTIGMVEEDSRFGHLFESLQGTPGQQRPTPGLLNSWCAESSPSENVRSRIRRLQELGLVESANSDTPLSSMALQVPTLLWDAMRGQQIEKLAPWATHRESAQLAEIDELIVPSEIRRQVKALSTLFISGEVEALIVRGPRHNGRRTLIGSVATLLGRGVLEVNGLSKADDERWRIIGPLATLLHAMPVIVLDLSPGETAELPSLHGHDAPLGIVMGKWGGVSGPAAERALTLPLEMPKVSARREHWLIALGLADAGAIDAISERYRMTSGNIRRTARLAVSYAALENREAVTPADVQQATRALNRQTLDTLAKRVNTSGDWSQLAVASQTLVELHNLESRCRHRERLSAGISSTLNADLNSGVRALFSGPSGTGKTLAARLLAAELQMDLYSLDLSTIVNKYIGETEKNLSQVFARAEDLDVILLLDEGDALLTQRTNVETSNDRYANLETNYLLQRLESFEGIIIVTTNAAERIDNAFQRRMDVVVDFRPPDAVERWAIWQMHLPDTHDVDASMLTEIASRCAMTGGQIRNAALQATVLALENGSDVSSAHLESAVQREYRKMGAVCPLRLISPPQSAGHQRA